jgi:hypothetical protein
MSAHFHVDLGPFIIDVQLDDSGVHLQRGPLSQVIAWQQISGATLITSTQFDGLHEKDEEQRAAQYLGQDALKTIQALRGKLAQIAIAIRRIICAKQKSPLRSPIRLFCANSKPVSAPAGSANAPTTIKPQSAFTPDLVFSKQFSYC